MHLSALFSDFRKLRMDQGFMFSLVSLNSFDRNAKGRRTKNSEVKTRNSAHGYTHIEPGGFIAAVGGLD
jgi:hypothetical protein